MPRTPALVALFLGISLLCPAICGGVTQDLELTPTAQLQIQNPDDPADVRYLWSFALPERVPADQVLLAMLRVPSGGVDEVTAVIASADGPWNSRSTWTTVTNSIPNMSATGFRPSFMQAAANLLEEDGGSVSSAGYEFDVRAEVRGWITTGINNGLWMGRVPGSSDDLRTTVGMAKEFTPRLVLTFRSSEP